jgi:hypothetical protein
MPADFDGRCFWDLALPERSIVADLIGRGVLWKDQRGNLYAKG